MSVFVVCCHLEVSVTVHVSPNEGVCCLLSVRGLCDGPE